MDEGNGWHYPKILKGLRLMPWVHEAERRNPGGVAISDCDTCMTNLRKDIRQSMGCAYEPVAPPAIYVATWDHEGRKHCSDEYSDTGEQLLKVCPGYLISLPEVIDVARAQRHWTHGELTSYCRGMARDEMLTGIEIFDGAMTAMTNWTMTPRKDGGGRD